jgi:transposase-like protein
MTKRSPFRYFKESPEIIRLAVMLYVRFSLSLRNVEDLLHERGIEISHETVRFRWNRFGPMCAAEILNKWVQKHQHDDLMSGPHEDVERENERLRKEVRLLREEREVLKKAAIH